MEINSVKTAKVYAEPGKYAYVAEAEFEENGEILYASVQELDMEDCTVSKDSMYAFLAEDGADPVEQFIAEYGSIKEAKESEYGKAFATIEASLGILKLG